MHRPRRPEPQGAEVAFRVAYLFIIAAALRELASREPQCVSALAAALLGGLFVVRRPVRARRLAIGGAPGRPIGARSGSVTLSIR